MRDDPEPGGEVCRRAVETARRYGLDAARGAALAFEAVTHARGGRRDGAGRCLTEARQLGRHVGEVAYNVAFAGAHLAMVDDDRKEAVRALARGSRPSLDSVGVEATGPNRGMLALLLAIDADADEAAQWLDPAPVHFLGRAYAAYARAVVAGRSGDGAGAGEHLAQGDRDLGSFSWYRHYGRRLVAEAALADGWGDPGSWLLEALEGFGAEGDARLASSCRSLLRRAGVPVPRRRGQPATQESLRAMGVTAREAEVLHLVGQGLANHDIAARLYMSPRTVERHVANLATKAGVARRSELVALAARLASGTSV